MAQVIEVPGEANPLTPQNVLNALILAASSTTQQVQTGTKQLANWEKREQYHLLLQVLFSCSTMTILLFLSVWLTIRYVAYCIGLFPRLLRPFRSQISRNNPTEEWH